MGDERRRDYAEYVTARLPTLHRTAYLLCGDRHRADDIVQAAITSLYVNWNRASRADNLDAYVHRILVRKFVDERRLRWSRVLLMWRLPEPAPADADPVEERDAVVAALRRLPRGQRTVLVLRYFCDLSVEASAQVMGCSTGNVKSQTARALAALRPHLEPATTQREQS
jgi:RNA polymerase sigma-70 factor (sigma-E family)